MALPSFGWRLVAEAAPREAVLGHLRRLAGGVEAEGLAVRAVRVSVMGLKESRPERANAVTISGLAMKFMVEGFASLRAGKLRLNDVTILELVRRRAR